MKQQEPTPKQQEAIESWNRGDVCVVAGPGSGKTLVLVERFKWLVQAKAVPIHRILAITFTEKAAANMRKRLVEAFPAGSPERKQIEYAYISTIHAFCARLLRENAIEAAVDPEFRVLDEWEADLELRRAIDETLESDYLAGAEPAREFLSRFGSFDVHGSLLRLYGALRAAGADIAQAGRIGAEFSVRQPWKLLAEAYDRVAALPAYGWNPRQKAALESILASRPKLRALAGVPAGREHLEALEEVGFDLRLLKRGSEHSGLLKHARDELARAARAAVLLEYNARPRRWFLEMLSRADERYRRSKQQSGALDYSDLEECAVGLLEKAAGRIAASFSFVLMDEFQDTNPLQAQLVGLLRSKENFFAVGDINQSIYGFRHADPTVFHGYREKTHKSGGHVVELLKNYRSRSEVLAAIKKIITGAEGIEPQELEAEKHFQPAEQPSLEILSVQAEDPEEAMKLEARHMAARIQELVGTLRLEAGPARYGDIAVLPRKTADARVFERVLRARGVPCQVTEGRGFYETREITDLLAFLRLLLNPLDEISLAAALLSPLAGVNDEALLRLKLARSSLIDALTHLDEIADLPAQQRERLERFRALLDRYRRERDYAPLDRLLGRLLHDTGYEAWLLEQPGSAQMAANVRKLMTLARRFQSTGLAGVQSFVERVEALRRDEVREAEAELPEQAEDAVRIMTVHAAKGLEFPVVFLPAINRGIRRDSDPVCFSPDIGIGMRWRDPVSGEVHSDSIAVAVAAEQRATKRDETQRLFYVAMTRAQELLALSASFGPQAKPDHWAANVRANLELDWAAIDNQVHQLKLGGIPVRLLRTNQETLPFVWPAPLRGRESAAGTPPVALVERASAGEQADAAVPASAVAVFAVCPRKYYLSRYLGFDAPRRRREITAEDAEFAEIERDEMDSTEFGRQVHALLAGQLLPQPADREALRLVTAFQSSVWGKRVAAAHRSEREQSFLIALGDGPGARLLRGQIDVWFEEGGETIVLDYKTDDVTAAEAPGRAAEYALQLRLYALAIERMTGSVPRRAVVYFLRPNVPVEVSVDAVALAAARAKVEELFQAQSRVEFPLRVGEHCFHCPHFRGLCPARYPAGEPQARSVAVE